MTLKEIAGKMNEAGKAADAVISEYKMNPVQDADELARVIRQYIGIKLQLEKDEISDNITVMVRISVSKAANIPLEELKKMDRPGACGSAPAVLAKRILLFLDVQKKLGAAMKPEQAQDIQTVQDLAGVLYPLLQDHDQL